MLLSSQCTVITAGHLIPRETLLVFGKTHSYSLVLCLSGMVMWVGWSCGWDGRVGGMVVWVGELLVCVISVTLLTTVLGPSAHS